MHLTRTQETRDPNLSLHVSLGSSFLVGGDQCRCKMMGSQNKARMVKIPILPKEKVNLRESCSILGRQTKRTLGKRPALPSVPQGTGRWVKPKVPKRTFENSLCLRPIKLCKSFIPNEVAGPGRRTCRI